MNKALIIFSHPRFEESRANRALLQAAAGLPRVSVQDLYEVYPDFNIDVGLEHELLLSHGIIICQFPIYMYSPPALLKQWIDLVLEHGWAHGAGGDCLKGKLVFCALTTGGSRQAYGPAGFNRYTIAEFLRPLEQTAKLCKMTWLPPFAVQGTYRLAAKELDDMAGAYRRAIVHLQESSADAGEICRHELMNDWSRTLGEQGSHA